MNGEVERLKLAIKRRGFPSAAEFARSCAIDPVTFRQQLNRGRITKDVARTAAARLRVPLDWLVNGTGADPFGHGAPPAALPPGDSGKVLIDPEERAMAIARTWPGWDALKPRAQLELLKRLTITLKSKD